MLGGSVRSRLDGPATGPQQQGAMSDAQLSHDAITADYRIYQRRRGHRYSLDDLATAWEAAHAVRSPERCIDIGCGIPFVGKTLAEFVAKDCERLVAEEYDYITERLG